MLHLKVFSFNPFSENTYVIYNEEKKGVLIDPGNWNEQENQLLADFLQEENIELQEVLLTHAHIDHVLGLQWVCDKYQLSVRMHPEEEELLKRNPLSAKNYGFNFEPFHGIIHFIEEGETYFLGEDALEILHIPGHSPGSIAFYSKEQNFIISGDALFHGSIGRTDLYRGNYEQLIKSISEKLFTLPIETLVHSGHGQPTRIGFERQNNPFFS